jgi:hypothetical protein
MEDQNKTHLSLVDGYPEAKCEIQGVNREKLEEAQKKSLYGKIERKALHRKLYKAREDGLVNLLDLSI